MRIETDEAPWAATVLPTLAFVSPWAAVSTLLPGAHRALAWLLVAALMLLLVAAAAWSRRAAHARGLDAQAWGFAATVSLGFSMLPLMLARAPAADPHGSTWHVCIDCGRRAGAFEAFCHGCGAY